MFGTKNYTNISIGNILKSAVVGSYDNPRFKLWRHDQTVS